MTFKLAHITASACLSASLLAGSLFLPAPALAADLTTQYRVYHQENILKEFRTYQQAVQFADDYQNAHVEKISDRSWVWDNYPRYRVFQADKTLPQWGFDTLQAAQDEARRWAGASVRDLQSGGWVWHNFEDALDHRYILYQGEKTLAHWQFNTLDAAQKEGKKWANSYIIDRNSNTWVWDNHKDEAIEKARAGEAVYELNVPFIPKLTERYSYLGDAIKAASNVPNASVWNTKKNTLVYENNGLYEVYQNQKLLKEFNQIDAAVRYAKKWAHATIKKQNRTIWSNYPNYQVYQRDRIIGEFNTIPKALSFAKQYSNASIQSYSTKDMIWNNYRKLSYWGWSGTTKNDTVYDHIAQTQGLDVSSPTWFELTDANGTLKDLSDAELAEWLKDQGKQVYPLVHNQFDSKLTSQFLNNPKAVQSFTQKLVDRSAELGVTGINVDFEGLAGSDRQAFTSFMKQLTDQAHAKQLKVSIDLPRGSVRWNHLTAFDHQALAPMVDYIITMTYDHHYSGSETPGSVAGMSWVEEGAKEFLAYGIERDKLILGIPFYVREWKLDAQGNLVSNRAITLKNIPDILRTKPVTKSWDERFDQYKIEYKENGYTHVFWLEDKESVKKRLDIAKKYDLAGVAIWRLGYDNEELWNTLIQNK